MKNNKKVLWITQGAIIAALYVALTYGQEMLLPGTTSMAVQFRASEALNLLCCLTPAAIPGLTLGCFLSNLMNVQALPVDMIVGPIATLLAGIAMYLLRNIRLWKLPLLAALMPAISNGIIIGAEIEYFFIGTEGEFHFLSFLTQGGLVALGELVVCMTLGLLLYKALDRPQLKKWIG